MTDKQKNYIDILVNDVGFSGAQWRAWLKEEFPRARDTGDLNVGEASIVIHKLLEMKESLS